MLHALVLAITLGKLLYEVQLFALSPAFPRTSKRIYQIFKIAPASYNAQYIMHSIRARKTEIIPRFFTLALRFPICKRDVVDILYRRVLRGNASQKDCELPKRLFRVLKSKPRNRPFEKNDEPLPFLEYLYNISGLRPDPNSHEGYALKKAVCACHEPLIQFLLEHDASPRYKNGQCIFLAIRQQNLALVKMLIERDDKNDTKGKRRKLEDRIVASTQMLKMAVKCNAHDIAEYLTQEKGIIPDMQTLLEISRML
ncbi:hypothetical protein APHAL10511_004537 [Amanita phalloides]|nr:hypothetical protein APHAL10511_004537 [Amanita phalloides]